MARPYVMPIGFIDRTTSEGTVFLLTTPEDSLELQQGTSITVWRYSPEQLALAKIRGRISAVGPGTHKRRRICDGNFQNRRILDGCQMAGRRGNTCGQDPCLPGPRGRL